jgi:hypothetical protein
MIYRPIFEYRVVTTPAGLDPTEVLEATVPDGWELISVVAVPEDVTEPEPAPNEPRAAGHGAMCRHYFRRLQDRD